MTLAKVIIAIMPKRKTTIVVSMVSTHGSTLWLSQVFIALDSCGLLFCVIMFCQNPPPRPYKIGGGMGFFTEKFYKIILQKSFYRKFLQSCINFLRGLDIFCANIGFKLFPNGAHSIHPNLALRGGKGADNTAIGYDRLLCQLIHLG